MKFSGSENFTGFFGCFRPDSVTVCKDQTELCHRVYAVRMNLAGKFFVSVNAVFLMEAEGRAKTLLLIDF